MVDPATYLSVFIFLVAGAAFLLIFLLWGIFRLCAAASFDKSVSAESAGVAAMKCSGGALALAALTEASWSTN